MATADHVRKSIEKRITTTENTGRRLASAATAMYCHDHPVAESQNPPPSTFQILLSAWICDLQVFALAVDSLILVSAVTLDDNVFVRAGDMASQ
ncbi:MAG: hypothetical protein IJ523_05265 [Succinivibrionaceae bacterium]|nr:hypothetical protein [Succinivibrionaceae bacterium]